MIIRLLLAFPLLHFLASCSGGVSSSSEVPKLLSPTRAKAWAPPTVTPTEDGHETVYTNPGNPQERLKIIASHKPMFFLFYPPNVIGTKEVDGVATRVSEPQVWQRTSVLGKPVKFYQRTLPSENAPALFRSLGEEFQAPDGRRASYRFEVRGTKKQMQSWLSELRFIQK